MPGTVPTEGKPSSLQEQGQGFRSQVSPSASCTTARCFYCYFADGEKEVLGVGDLSSSHSEEVLAEILGCLSLILGRGKDP